MTESFNKKKREKYFLHFFLVEFYYCDMINSSEIKYKNEQLYLFFLFVFHREPNESFFVVEIYHTKAYLNVLKQKVY